MGLAAKALYAAWSVDWNHGIQDEHRSKRYAALVPTFCENGEGRGSI